MKKKKKCDKIATAVNVIELFFCPTGNEAK